MTVSELYGAHHAACDTAFADAEAAGAEGRWPEAEATTRRFAALLSAHLAAEEETLFPAFEAKTGMTQGPTTVMRLEHAQMRSLLEQMLGAVTAKDADEFSGAAGTLLVLMQQHNMKEERILYPACDRALEGDAAVLATSASRLG